MLYLTQRDTRWSEKKLGASNLTLGRYGCTTTCLSMLSSLFGFITYPDAIASHKDWYTPDGLIIWNKLAIPGLIFQWRQYGRNDTKILAALKDPNKGVILQVGNGSHWVVAVRKLWWKNDYLIVDPWTGKTGTAVGDYKNITGAAYFAKK